MQRYKVNMLMPTTVEIVVKDETAAHTEAKRLTLGDNTSSPGDKMQPVLHSIEFVQDEPELEPDPQAFIPESEVA